MDTHSHIMDKDTKNNMKYIPSFLVPGAHRSREELGLLGPADFIFLYIFDGDDPHRN